MATSKHLQVRLSHIFHPRSFVGVPCKRAYIIWVFNAHGKGLAISHGSKPNLHRVMPMTTPSLRRLRQYGVDLNLKR